MEDFTTLSKAPYVSLRTFRKSGAVVDTPVWCAPHDNALFVFSAGHAGKVKRLLNNPRAELARCDVRGKILSDWVPAHATVISDSREIPRMLSALRTKYGWQMLIADLGAKLTGKMTKRAYIEIVLEPSVETTDTVNTSTTA